MKWSYLTTQTPNNKDELIQFLLKKREIKSNSSFLNPVKPSELDLKQLNIDVKELKQAAQRLKKAAKSQEKVVVFGDYDADGITAAALIWLTLNKMGVEAIPFIPDRKKHGYGISSKALKEVKAKYEPDLILTVDNGIVAHQAADWIYENDMELIITDHHQAQESLPQAEAIVHSTLICGAAVAWILSRELIEEQAANYLDLVGIATIADQMSLVGPNRSFAQAGIKALKKTKRVGLQALYKEAGVKPGKISSFTIGYVIAPRINAVGRLDQGIRAVRLLCTNNVQAAKNIARKLDLINRERQDLTKAQLDLALNDEELDQSQKLLFVSSDQFHQGIIGLIAGRLTEKYHRPSIVVSTKGKVGKASARSVAGVDITNLIRQVEDLLEDAGGHELAAGFSVRQSNLNEVKAKLIALTEEQIDQEMLQPKLKVEFDLNSSLIHSSTVELIDQLKPFGLGNYPPVFGLKQLKVADAFQIGKANNHLKMVLKPVKQDDQHYKAIGWNRGRLVDKLKPGQIISVAASLEMNHWQGKSELQLKIKDINFEQ